MVARPRKPEDCALAYETWIANDKSYRKGAKALGWDRKTFTRHVHEYASHDATDLAAVKPGFKIAKITNTPRGDFVQQKPDLGTPYKPIDTLSLKGRTSWAEVMPDGQRVVTREVLMERAGAEDYLAAMHAVVEGMKETLPRERPVAPPSAVVAELLNQYTICDSHLGMLAWGEESGADYDLKIGEQLLLDWFSAAIQTAPRAHTAVLAQLGDLMHHDGLDSVTPTSHHVLDADSRLQKVIRVVIRCMRQIVAMLLDTHQHVHIVMASGNHDPASSAWLRELFAVLYEDEPRVTVDTSPSLYYAFEWGDTALFYHHGHKRNVGNVDRTFAGKFREVYGRCRYSFGHTGHLHSDAKSPANSLFPIEQHETLAAADAYAAGGGWLSGRSAKVITYSKRFGEVGRSTLRPEMVMGAVNGDIAA